MRFYFASKYSNREALLPIRAAVENAGHTVTSRWLNGQHEGRSGHELQIYALEDVNDIARAQALVLFELPYGDAPPSTGRAFELGYAYGIDRSMIIVGQKRSVFHYLPCVEHYEFVQDFIEAYT